MSHAVCQPVVNRFSVNLSSAGPSSRVRCSFVGPMCCLTNSNDTRHNEKKGKDVKVFLPPSLNNKRKAKSGALVITEHYSGSFDQDMLAMGGPPYACRVRVAKS